MADHQRFGEAQLEVFGPASFGWAYWTSSATFFFFFNEGIYSRKHHIGSCSNVKFPNLILSVNLSRLDKLNLRPTHRPQQKLQYKPRFLLKLLVESTNSDNPVEIIFTSTIASMTQPMIAIVDDINYSIKKTLPCKFCTPIKYSIMYFLILICKHLPWLVYFD